VEITHIIFMMEEIVKRVIDHKIYPGPLFITKSYYLSRDRPTRPGGQAGRFGPAMG
jgi:hypothetical protein